MEGGYDMPPWKQTWIPMAMVNSSRILTLSDTSGARKLHPSLFPGCPLQCKQDLDPKVPNMLVVWACNKNLFLGVETGTVYERFIMFLIRILWEIFRIFLVIHNREELKDTSLCIVTNPFSSYGLRHGQMLQKWDLDQKLRIKLKLDLPLLQLSGREKNWGGLYLR